MGARQAVSLGTSLAYKGSPETSRRNYQSPYGCQSAPLRNLKLANAIRHFNLLANGKYNTCKITDGKEHKRFHFFRFMWLIISWLYLGGVIFLWRYALFGVLPKSTWVGITNIVVLTGWSVFVRTIEIYMVNVREKEEQSITRPEDDDAVIFMGDDYSALVIEGRRKQIKHWTAGNRLDYINGKTRGIRNELIQIFTRIGTILVLVLVFVTVPNGSTTDQLVFVLFNILGQVNLYLGLHINAKSCWRELGPVGQLRPKKRLGRKKESTEEEGSRLKELRGYPTFIENRTHIWGNLLRHFKGKEVDKKWVEKVSLLPQTNVWTKWAAKVVVDCTSDPKKIYDDLLSSPNLNHTEGNDEPTQEAMGRHIPDRVGV